MQQVLSVMNQLISISSRNGKEDILKNNQDNVLLKDILTFVYTTEVKTGIKRKKLEKKVKSKPTVTINNFYDLREYLSIHNTGSDEAIANIQQFLSQQEDDMKELYIQIILQDLRCGLKEKTINSAFGYEYR